MNSSTFTALCSRLKQPSKEIESLPMNITVHLRMVTQEACEIMVTCLNLGGFCFLICTMRMLDWISKVYSNFLRVLCVYECLQFWMFWILLQEHLTILQSKTLLNLIFRCTALFNSICSNTHCRNKENIPSSPQEKEGRKKKQDKIMLQ